MCVQWQRHSACTGALDEGGGSVCLYMQSVLTGWVEAAHFMVPYLCLQDNTSTAMDEDAEMRHGNQLRSEGQGAWGGRGGRARFMHPETRQTA